MARLVSDDKVETCEEESPSSLTGINSFCLSQIFQISMVSNDLKAMVCSLQPTSLLLEGELDGEELSIADVVILLHQGQLFGVEGTWMRC